MYLYKERIKAVKLLLQYDMSYSTVVRELGYPPKQLFGSGTTSICRKEIFIRNLLSHRNLWKMRNRGPSIITLSMENTFLEPLGYSAILSSNIEQMDTRACSRSKETLPNRWCCCRIYSRSKEQAVGGKHYYQAHMPKTFA